MKSFSFLQRLAGLFVILFLYLNVVAPPPAESAPASDYLKYGTDADSAATAVDPFLDEIISKNPLPSAAPSEATEPAQPKRKATKPMPPPPEPKAAEPAPPERESAEPEPAQSEPAAAEPAPTESEATGYDATESAATYPAGSRSGTKNKGLTNIVLTEKGIKAYGWGEYKVGGRCLCCDNFLDGDCIVVHTTNRSEKTRIKQIVDKKTAADTSDKSTYFGDVLEREQPVPVDLLMAEIDLTKMRDIYRVTVYTMVNQEKKKNYLSNCELGYYDRFDRLQWVGKKESEWSDKYITFEFDKPVFTKSVLLKVKGGTSKITEVALFSKNNIK